MNTYLEDEVAILEELVLDLVGLVSAESIDKDLSLTSVQRIRDIMASRV